MFKLSWNPLGIPKSSVLLEIRVVSFTVGPPLTFDKTNCSSPQNSSKLSLKAIVIESGSTILKLWISALLP